MTDTERVVDLTPAPEREIARCRLCLAPLADGHVEYDDYVDGMRRSRAYCHACIALLRLHRPIEYVDGTWWAVVGGVRHRFDVDEVKKRRLDEV
ncbi:MAG: hypothetical protein M0R66_03770 [Candidatus Omnitrophica bacterium]|nr:hypothetical protein [Candidatus Omnitrophota bacterium]